MFNKEKIPEHTYKTLIELFGKEKAEELILKNHYNHKALFNIIVGEQIIRALRLEKFRNYIEANLGISFNIIGSFLLIYFTLLIALIYYWLI